MRQLEALTSLRFFAAFFVLAFHYQAIFAPNPGRTSIVTLGYTGVTFFFVLSGFILAYTYSAVDFTVRGTWRRYILARIARIYPVFIVSLVIALPFFLAQVARIDNSLLKFAYASSAVLAPLGLHAWVPGAACALNCPSWSISAEIFFYALFPLLLPAIAARPRQWLVITLGTWIAMSAVYFVLWSGVATGISIIDNQSTTEALLAAHLIKFLPLGRLPEFMLGILVYCAWSDPRPLLTPRQAIATAALAALFISLFTEHIPVVLLHNGLTALIWAPLIFAAAGVTSGMLTWPLLTFLGRISFSLYLLHIPVSNAVQSIDKRLLGDTLLQFPYLTAFTTLLLAILLSIAVYGLIEEPARRWNLRRFGRPIPAEPASPAQSRA